MTHTKDHSKDSNIEASAAEVLLPWYATGQLDAGLASNLQRELERDPALQAHLARIEEERAESIHAAESIEVPFQKMANRFYASLNDTRNNHWFSWITILGEHVARLRPQMLGAMAMAACLTIVFLGGSLATRNLADSTYLPASENSTTSSGTFILASFQPNAKVSEVEDFAAEMGISIVDGPRAGSIFKLRIGDADMLPTEKSTLLERLKESKTIVRALMSAQ